MIAVQDSDESVAPALWWLAAAAVFGALVVPFFLVDMPPVLDYPNHLARLYVLAFGPGDPVLSAMYQPEWRLVPNLAIDLVGPPLMQVMPVDVVGRILLAGSLVAPVAGVIVYHRAVFGVRSWWPLASAVVAFNGIFFMGFMNFLYGVGIAFMGAALWIRFIDRRPLVAIAGCAGVAVVLFLCHLVGILFLALLIGSRELAGVWQLRADRKEAIRRALWRGAAIGVALVPALVLYRYSVVSETSAGMKWVEPFRKLIELLVPFMTYGKSLTLAAFVLVGAAFILLWRNTLVDAGSAIAFVVLLAVYAAAPGEMKSVAFVDTRLTAILGFLAFAGIRPVVPVRAAATVAAGAAMLLVVQTGFVAYVWHDHRRDLAEFRESIRPVEPGARVLVVTGEGVASNDYFEREPPSRKIPLLFRTDLHMASLLLIENRAFWPLLFADRRQQPLVAGSQYASLALPTAPPPDYRVLVYDVSPEDLELLRATNTRELDAFDYVLLTHAGAVDDVASIRPDKLELLNVSDTATLFRIRKEPPEQPDGQQASSLRF